MEGETTTAKELLDRLSAEELAFRLSEREAECDALRTLLRAAKQRDRGRCPVSAGGRGSSSVPSPERTN